MRISESLLSYSFLANVFFIYCKHREAREFSEYHEWIQGILGYIKNRHFEKYYLI